MINVKYFNSSVSKPLERSTIEGTLRYAGYAASTAASVTSTVVNRMQDRTDTVSYKDLVQFIADEVKDSRIRKNYLAINQFLMAAYNRSITTPFYFMIGGTSGTGKDTLANELSHYLGTETPVSTDLLRFMKRQEVLQQYENDEDKVPAELKPLFGASYKMGIDGFLLQVEYVGQKIPEIVGQTSRQGQEIMRPIYILQGIHVVPGTEDHVEGNNKHLVILNPSYDALSTINLVRFEQERGPTDPTNEAERSENFSMLYTIQEHILQMAHERESTIICADRREDMLHKFSDSLTPKLEKILQSVGVDLINN